MGAVRWGLAALVTLAVGCNTTDQHSETLEVYAAASLTDAFLDLEAAFEATHPEVDVVSTFAGSQVLRLQIESGAPADVFASANPEHMAALVASGRVAAPVDFAQNTLVIITPPQATDVTSLDTLVNAERIVIGSEAVPIGRYTRALLAAQPAGFDDRAMARVVSEESNVRLIRAKVELGEADAALVYRTDAVHADGVRVVDLPDGVSPVATYPIGRVTTSTRPTLAEDWIAFVQSSEGQAILASHGFLAAP